MKIIEVKNLKKRFPIKSQILKVEKGYINAVNGINFDIEEGQTLGLVGESGSGKSTAAKLILRLLDATEGNIYFKGEDISKIPKKDFRKLRKDLQIIFQNPYSALDTKMTIEDILIEPLMIHNIVSPLEYRKEVERLLDIVGIASRDMKKFPQEFSGGQRQRIGIARALASRPKFIVCDEPVSALDVSVQSKILNLLIELQKEFKLSYLFIAHGLNVMKHVSDKIAVMYLGKILEHGHVDEIFNNPKHPYTKNLIAAAPVPDPEYKQVDFKLQDEIPSSINYPKGCVFHTRCPVCMDVCKSTLPDEIIFENGHRVSCHFVKGKAESGAY